jgi:hypothetical protein
MNKEDNEKFYVQKLITTAIFSVKLCKSHFISALDERLGSPNPLLGRIITISYSDSFHYLNPHSCTAVGRPAQQGAVLEVQVLAS